MKNWRWLAALVLAVGVGLSVAVLAPAADDKKGDNDEAPNPVIEKATLAYQTAQFGRDNKSPEALVAAAMMLRSLQSAEKKIEAIAEQPTDENGKPVKGETVARRSFGDQADDLFDEAKVLAKDLGLKNFDAFVNSAKSRELKGVVGGARAIKRKLAPGKTEVFHFSFENEKPCEIAIHAAPHPVHFVVEHDHTHALWSNGLLMHGAIREWPHGKRGETTGITVKITNPDKKNAVEFELFVR